MKQIRQSIFDGTFEQLKAAMIPVLLSE
jgi:hypothetical protein